MKKYSDIISLLDPDEIFHNSHDAFIVSDSEKIIRFVNNSACRIFGYSADELTGKSIFILMSEDRTKNYELQMEKVLSGKTVTNIDSGEKLYGKRKNGLIFPIELTYVGSRIGDEKFFISQIRDISNRIEREKQLLITSTARRVISETNRLLIKSVSENDFIQGVCDIITGIGGYSKSLIIYLEKTKDDTVLNPKAFSGFNDYLPDKQLLSISSIKHKGSPTFAPIFEKRTDVCRNIRAKGLWKYWKNSPDEMEFDSTVSVPIFSGSEVTGVLRVYSYDPLAFAEHEIKLLEELSEDISHGIDYFRTLAAHGKTLKQLEESEKRYRTLFESSNDAILLADAETGIIIDANQRSEDILNREPNDIVGMNISELHTAGYEDKLQAMITELEISQESVTGEFIIRLSTSGGKAVPVEVSIDYVYINEKKTIQCIFRDLTKQKAEEERIRTTQKMEALGTLSGGIAHDINNILSPIIGFTQLALKEKYDPHKRSECLNEVLTAANRAKELISQILTFCRKSDSEKRPHRIHNIIKEVLKLISLSKPDNVRIETVVDENAEPILCDPVQIYQVVINLCTNAFHAMREKGGILKVCLVRKGSPEIKGESFENLPDNYICLIVSDTGCGMKKFVLNRIFEPYFTTKQEGEGTGLGLSVVSGIVKEHGGEIYTRTYPNEGTYFKLTFPVAEREPESANLLIRNLNKDKQILIMAIDDEPQITFMLKFMLEELGHTSETFTDPEKALESFRNEPSKYDLIITDQTMPGIPGTELSRKMLEIRPDVPIILNTGYSPVASKDEAKKIGIKHFVMKPLTILDLSYAINESVK